MTGQSSTLSFYGGTGSVTGANFVLDTGDLKIAIDCGLEQGVQHGIGDPNRSPFAYDPRSIDVLFITHAHIDHIGRVPKFVHEGFSGPIYSTPATNEIAQLMFDDALGIMQGEYREHGLPLMYDAHDAARALSQWRTIEYHEPLALEEGIEVRLLDAGHVLGSAMIRMTRSDRTIVFTGDLGNTPTPILRDTEPLKGADYLLIESVYGDRVHEHRDMRQAVLRDMIEGARKRGGTLMIPAFSLERTQVILYEINTLIQNGMEPIDIYLDSPLATRINAVYRRHTTDFNDTARARAAKSDIFTFPKLHVSAHPADSDAIKDAPNPKVIIAGSGMSHGGRILGHEQHFLSDPNAALLFVGYQAAGTAGRRIQEGEKKVRIDGEWVTVRAHIDTLHGYSGHKDRDGLLEVVEGTAATLEKVFVAMGEPRSAQFLAQRIHDFLGLDAIAPKEGDSFPIRF